MFNITDYRKMQIKTTKRHHLKPVKMALSKKKERKKEITNVGKEVKKREPSWTANGNVNWL